MSATTISVQTPRVLSWRVALFAIGCLAAVGLFVVLIQPSSQSVASARTASDFSLPAVNGAGNVAYSSASGKPAVVNFFASWCIPCRRELPRLSAASKDYPGVTFMGIDDQDSRSQAQDLLTASSVTYPAGYDPKGSVGTDYGVTTGLPATVFIDKSGKIKHMTLGEVSDAELKTQLAQLAGGK